MTRLALAVALVLLPLGAWAEDEVEPISPDRAGASTSTDTVGRGAVQLEAGLAYSRERTGGAPVERRLDLNASLAAIGQSRPSGYLLQAVLAAGLSHDVGDWLTLFTDVMYASREERDSRDGVLFDAGVIWRPARDVALDASVVTSLAGRGPDWQVRGGLSLRFGR